MVVGSWIWQDVCRCVRTLSDPLVDRDRNWRCSWLRSLCWDSLFFNMLVVCLDFYILFIVTRQQEEASLRIVQSIFRNPCKFSLFSHFPPVQKSGSDNELEYISKTSSSAMEFLVHGFSCVFILKLLFMFFFKTCLFWFPNFPCVFDHLINNNLY